MDPTVPSQAGKARSRLQNRQESNQQAKSDHLPTARRVQQKPVALTSRYITYWPLLVITLAHIFLLQNVVHSVDPENWKHLILPNTYLPMLLLITSTVFFGSSYIFLNTARGLRVALIIFFIFFFEVSECSYRFCTHCDFRSPIRTARAAELPTSKKAVSKNNLK